MKALYPRTTPLQRTLARSRACREARIWAGKMDVHEVWATCHRGDWMLWLAAEAGANHDAVLAVLRGLQKELTCVMDEIPTKLEELQAVERGALLGLAAEKLRALIPSSEIAKGLGLKTE